MRAPVVRPGGNLPAGDGDINLYIAPECVGASWFDPDRRVIFINGMDNSPEDHARAARGLSVLQACPVIGVYNRTDGFFDDVMQCISDKLTMMGMQAEVGLTFPQWVAAVDRAFERARARDATLNRADLVGQMVARNPATLALYSLLVTMSQTQRSSRLIVCHSQGNLITSNALTTVALALGMDSLRGVDVQSFGSPCRYWPPVISQHNHAFTFDPVALLNLRMGMSGTSVGFVGLAGIPQNLDPMYAHSFLRYMEYDGEFIVNRFRWGSFGLTANMDEEGLARYLVSLGRNTPRIRAVFERLRDAHWSDSDDVAYAYVNAASDTVLRAVKSADPGLIDLLIELLDAGWTTAAEEEAILRLRMA